MPVSLKRAAQAATGVIPADCGPAPRPAPPEDAAAELRRRLEGERRYCLGRSRDLSRGGALSGRHPGDGGEWLDWHFRAEAVHGLLAALRFGHSLDEAVACGVEDARHAAELWNAGRGTGLQRAVDWADAYLRELVLILSRG